MYQRLFCRVFQLVPMLLLTACSDGAVSSQPEQIVPTAIAVTPVDAAVEIGRTVQLSARVTDANGAQLDVPVTWTSTDVTRASVTPTGLVTGLAEASIVVIEARAGSVTASAQISVRLPPVATVAVTLARSALLVGETTQATAVLRDLAGSALSGRAVIWTTSDSAVALVNADGVVAAVSQGSAQLRASSEGRFGAADISVSLVPVSVVTVTPVNSTLIPGEALQLAVSLRDSAGSPLVGRSTSWSASDTGIVAVSATGLVTARSVGQASITATSEGRNGVAQVTVLPPPVASIQVSPLSAILPAGGTTQFAATLRDQAGHVLTGRTIFWTSSDSSVARVSQSGLVTAVRTGSAAIAVSSETKAVSIPITVTSERVGLSIADSSALTGWFEALSSQWVQSAVDAANGLLMFNTSYTAADWESFFRGYFSTHVLTQQLAIYLQYPLMYWGTPASYARVQPGAVAGLIQHIRDVTPRADLDVQRLLAGSPERITAILNAYGLLNTLAERSAVATIPASVYQFARQFALDYSRYIVQPVSNPSLGRIGELRKVVQFTIAARSESSSALREDVIGVLGLAGIRADVLRAHKTLIIDNWGLDQAQLVAVETQLRLVPASLYRLLAITVDEFLGIESATFIANTSPHFTVNIFAVRLHLASQNQFPTDIAPWIVPIFGSGMAHELNHVVDAVAVEGNPTLRARRDALIAAAGSDSMNYLRSMVPSGFFLDAPQEFIASISNQWLTNTERTVQLGLQRFAAGRPQPLNQALFMAEVYSLGASTTPMYTMSSTGSFTRIDVPVSRNASGFITGITTASAVYSFTRDAAGNVLSATAAPR